MLFLRDALLKVYALLEDVESKCEPSATGRFRVGGWREVIEFNIVIFVGNNPFPNEEHASEVFNGTAEGSAQFSVTNNVTVSFDPTLSYDFRMGAVRLDYARILVEASPMIDQLLTVSATARGTIDAIKDLTTVRLNDLPRARDQVLAWAAGRFCLVPI